jgi:hypothetical protein
MTSHTLNTFTISSTSLSSMCGNGIIYSGGGGGGAVNVTASPGMNMTTTWAPSVTPEIIDTMIEQLVTRVKPGEKIVVCVDDDMTWEQVHEVQRGLKENKLSGIVIRGARAGTGFNAGYVPPTDEDRRVDILARIGDLWEKCPSLRLTDLLNWYNGDSMTDEEFATSIEIHFTKVTNAIHRKP